VKPLVVVAAMALALGACNRNEGGGPGEKAGRAVDRAMEKAGKSVEQAGRDMQDASKGKK
jgi:hypothetical protein